MTAERDGRPERCFAQDLRAKRSRNELIKASESKPAQLPPGQSTLTEFLDPAPVEIARVFDAQLEIVSRQIAALEAAHHAGDHHASGLAASAIRAALRIAEKVVAEARAESEGGAAVLERRLAGARDAVRPALEQAFMPSPAARREAVDRVSRAQWDREVAAWRVARGRAGLAAATSMPRGPEPDASPQHAAAVEGAAGASAEPWEYMFGEASTPVNKLGRVQAPKGRTLLQKPGPGSAPSVPAPLPFDTPVMVLRRTMQPAAAERWCYVTAPEHGATGFCEERYLAIDPPEPRARLHRVEGGETLGKIARDAYGEHITGGNDARLYVQGLYEANKDRAGVKLTPVELSWADAWHRQEAEEKTLKVYLGVQVLKGMSLWIPSNELIQRLKASGAITTGSSELSKAWRTTAKLTDDAIEAVKYAAGFIVGLLEGAWFAIIDLFKGAAEVVGAIAQVLYHLVTGNLGRIKDMLVKWVDKMKSAWEHRGQIADELMTKWNAPSGWDRGRFQGEVLGWVMMTVLIIIVTAGSSAAASAGSLAARFPQVVKLLKTVDAVGDVTTYLGGAIKGIHAAGKLPEAASDIVKARLGKANLGHRHRRADTMIAGELGGPKAPRPGPGAAHIHDEAFDANRTYEPSPKHTAKDRKLGHRKVAKEPADGATALELSFQISPRSPRRIGIDPKNKEFVVFDRTGNKIENKQIIGGIYHGHVRAWNELEDAMKKTLIDQGVVEHGLIKIDPSRWDLSP